MDANSLPPLSPPGPSWNGAKEYVPPSGTPVLYRTAYYQMLGYMSRLGCWIGSDGKEEHFPVEWWREV